ncbi:hypothetical protein [Paenibacillus sp. FSL H8-0537]|uniref:hypothetical protein n=1 Tax=Paenibacillus sp. FSL H8-0537 TaxID=2921399 RepID=UPI0031014040
MRYKLAGKALLALLVALVAWEGILEVTTIRTTGFQQHPELGRILNPGLYVNGQEGYGITKIYAEGAIAQPFPDPNETAAARKAEYRILFLGDSYTEALQVGDQVKFFRQVQTRMPELDSRKVMTYDAGRSSASPAHYAYLADFYKKRVDPDAVVIQINENDLKDLYGENASYYATKDGDSYKLVFNEDFISRNAVAAKLQAFYGLLRLSVVRVGSDHLQKLLEKDEAAPEDTKSPDFTPQAGDEQLVNWIFGILKEKYPKLVFVFLPQIDFQSLDGEQQPGYFEELAERTAKEQGIPMLNMRRDFVNAYQDTGLPAYGFSNTTYGTGHMNSSGHDLVSKAVAKYFEGR